MHATLNHMTSPVCTSPSSGAPTIASTRVESDWLAGAQIIPWTDIDPATILTLECRCWAPWLAASGTAIE